MWTVQINNFVKGDEPISGWSIVSTHSVESDATFQMNLYIQNNSIDPSNIKVVAG